jgi:hypothetical protein
MNPPQPNRRTRRWQKLAVVILLLGGLVAGLVFWRGQPAAALADDPAMLGYDRASHRQMGMFFGKSGYVIDDLLDQLKKPDTQALLIFATAVLLAGGCLFFSRQPEIPPDPDFFEPSLLTNKTSEPPAGNPCAQSADEKSRSR